MEVNRVTIFVIISETLKALIPP